MPSHTAEYWFIELALAEHARSFGVLDGEISSFQSLPIESLQSKKREMWDRIRPLNTDAPAEELTRFIDSQVAAGCSASTQFYHQFLERFAAEAVAITILSHSLCEAIINAILAIGLSAQGQDNLFKIFEPSNLKDKWTIAPLVFLPKYLFPKTGTLYESLSVLCTRRNSYVHSKITLRNNDNSVLIAGSSAASVSIDPAGRAWLKRFLHLPYELHSHVCAQTEDKSLRFRMSHLLGNKPQGI